MGRLLVKVPQRNREPEHFRRLVANTRVAPNWGSSPSTTRTGGSGERSVGVRRRPDLALVLAAQPHILLLDEPTDHQSAALGDELAAALGATPAAVVLATHDRQLLRDTASWPRLELG